MNIQEQEENEFNPQSEAQNCLTEAEAKCAELDRQCKVEGTGRFKLTVRAPYYCRATDAIAGTYRILEFSDNELLVVLNRRKAFWEDEELSCNVVDTQPAPIIQESQATIDDKNVPF